jgi:serine/threonine protein phosphatase PrpC
VVTYYYISEKGTREINEDSISVAKRDNNFCFTLCDGLGGHNSGDVASSTVTEIFSELFQSAKISVDDFFMTAYTQANCIVNELQNNEDGINGMKTTVASLVISDNKCVWSHLGDSRIYCFNKWKLKSRTLDHSVPQMLVKENEISEKEIRFHPNRNRLLRVIGGDTQRPKYDVSGAVEIDGFYAFLICSDGFWELIDEREMRCCLLRSKTPEQWLNLMEKIVLKHGKNKAMDNYSAIGVFVKP